MEDERESGRMRGWKQSNTQGEEESGEGEGNMAGDTFLYDDKMMSILRGSKIKKIVCNTMIKHC